MADIQKCLGHKDGVACSVAFECYRFTATASDMQTYGPPSDDFDPLDGCDLYIPVERKPRRKNELNGF